MDANHGGRGSKFPLPCFKYTDSLRAHMEASDLSWLKVCGKEDSLLAEDLRLAVSNRVEAGNFRQQDVEYIARLPVSLSSGKLDVNDLQLEKLRRLCQLADVQLVPTRISSHRPYIGPVIVMAKKLLFSVLAVLLKDTLRKQRDFNAAVIAYLTTPSGLSGDGSYK